MDEEVNLKRNKNLLEVVATTASFSGSEEEL